MPLVQGDLLNKRYRIIEVLGHGGMGSVYRAHDESLDVDVAVKENLFTTEDYARQFRLEATILASLRHPNLPRVSDHFVMADEGQYLVMDYIQGPDLRQILEKEGPISEEEAIRIGAAICDALNFLHTRNPAVLHRDIKLGNIKLVPDGNICLVDFGLAKIIEGDQPTMTGARAMTPGYSPPEQYGSSRTDARSDVYSLGATLYAAITGFIPEDSLARALEGLELTPVRTRNPKISERLAAVIEKSMETTPANRFQSALDFKYALLGTERPSEQPTSSKSQPAKNISSPQNLPSNNPGRRLSARPFLLLGLILLLTLAGLFYANPGVFPFLAASLATPTATTTLTNTPLPASDFIATATLTPTSSSTPTSSPTPTATATLTPSSTATPAPTNTPQPTPLGGGAGQIAFVTLREGIPQIYTMNLDGSQKERLFLAPDGACQPKWSPDGMKLAYISPCPGRQLEYPNASILAYDLITGETDLLVSESGGDFDPSWAPDGQSLGFTSLRDGTALNPLTQIYKINIENKEVVRLTPTDSTQPARQPAWSRDGERIIYSVSISGVWRIWSVSANGEGAVPLFRSGGGFNDTQPAWAFDNLSIFFTQFRGGLASLPFLARYDLERGEVETLTTAEPSLRKASPSPDGLWLVAEGSDGSNIDIYLLNILTREITRLTTDPGIDFDPDWQP
jgi:eukaryotic-like serine/threonine-protein kinase